MQVSDTTSLLTLVFDVVAYVQQLQTSRPRLAQPVLELDRTKQAGEVMVLGWAHNGEARNFRVLEPGRSSSTVNTATDDS
ncbi:hypothetical protein ACET3Z_004340 [Daucus carota]